MTANLAEWFTGVVVILLFLTATLVMPYAYRELRADPRRLRGMFALAFAGTCFGTSFRLAIGWLVLTMSPGQRTPAIAALNQYIIAACLVLAIFATLGIRMVTIGRYGELGWIVSLAVAAAAATAVLMFL